MMKKPFGSLFAVGLSMSAILAPGALAQAPSAPTTLDEAARRAVVEAAAEALRSRYVFPDVGERAAAAIESALAEGGYDELDQPRVFAERLTVDLQAVTADRHLNVSAPGAAPDPAAAPAAPPRSEGGVTRADRLPGDVGYIELIAFPPPELFIPSVDRALAPLADTSALIIDVRRNGGGSPVSVAHLVSYFLDTEEPVHINSFIWRNPGTETFRTQEFWSNPTPFSYTGRPVYVLTSGRTFSGGEELAYDMQVMQLGILVGETTGGGANPGGGVPIGAGLGMFVPGGRAENPITGTNWEGVGVLPDVATSSQEALQVALEQLGHAADAIDVDTLSEARLFEPRTTAQPGAEAALRRMSAELAVGEPDYELLSESMAQTTRAQLEGLQRRFSELGAIESVRFVEVGPMGEGVYEVDYAHGSLIWSIVLGEDGRTVMAGIRPVSPRP